MLHMGYHFQVFAALHFTLSLACVGFVTVFQCSKRTIEVVFVVRKAIAGNGKSKNGLSSFPPAEVCIS